MCNIREFREQQEQEIEKIEKQIEDLQKESDEVFYCILIYQLGGRRVVAENEMQNTREKKEGNEAHLYKMNDQIRNTANAINDAKESKKDPLYAFGAKMPQVVRDIEDAERGGRWRGKMPVGPIGNLLNLYI